MTPEQLQAAFAAGVESVELVKAPGESWPDVFGRRHAAGLAEVARQQAERDARVARDRAKTWHNQSERTEGSMSETSWGMSRAALYVADAIRAQFRKGGD